MKPKSKNRNLTTAVNQKSQTSSLPPFRSNLQLFISGWFIYQDDSERTNNQLLITPQGESISFSQGQNAFALLVPDSRDMASLAGCPPLPPPRAAGGRRGVCGKSERRKGLKGRGGCRPIDGAFSRSASFRSCQNFGKFWAH